MLAATSADPHPLAAQPSPEPHGDLSPSSYHVLPLSSDEGLVDTYLTPLLSRRTFLARMTLRDKEKREMGLAHIYCLRSQRACPGSYDLFVREQLLSRKLLLTRVAPLKPTCKSKPSQKEESSIWVLGGILPGYLHFYPPSPFSREAQTVLQYSSHIRTPRQVHQQAAYPFFQVGKQIKLTPCVSKLVKVTRCRDWSEPLINFLIPRVHYKIS